MAFPDKLASCHTAVVNGYTVEGHVPASDISAPSEDQAESRWNCGPWYAYGFSRNGAGWAS